LKRILIISYYWPPAGGVVVRRVLALAKYLPEHGFEPIVLSAGGEYPWLYLDKTAEIPGVEVYRVDAGDLNRLFSPNKTPLGVRLKTAFRALFRTDYMADWVDRALPVAERIIREREIDIVLVTSPPFSLLRIIAEFKRSFPNVKTVADLRDVFYNLRTDNIIQSARRSIALPKIERYLRSADIIVGVSAGFEKELGGFGPPFYTVTNGFDCDIASETEYKKGEYFQIVHAGSFPSRGRTPEFILKGFWGACRENSDFGGKTRLIFAGVKPDEILDIVGRFPNIYCNIELPGMLSYNESMRLQKTCDVNLLVETIPASRGGDTVIPLKLFEQIASGRPVLATVPTDGVAANMVREMELGLVCHYDDTCCIKTALLTLFDEWVSDKLRRGVDSAMAEKYRFGNCIARYAGVLKELVS